MHDQKDKFFNQIIRMLQNEFSIGFNKGQCLTHIIKEWSKCLDVGAYMISLY